MRKVIFESNPTFTEQRLKQKRARGINFTETSFKAVSVLTRSENNCLTVPDDNLNHDLNENGWIVLTVELWVVDGMAVTSNTLELFEKQKLASVFQKILDH